jgi:hypothetical protein
MKKFDRTIMVSALPVRKTSTLAIERTVRDGGACDQA